MIDATLLPFDLPSVRRKKLTVDFSGGNQSSNGGLLLLRNAERKLGVCGRLADAMPDRRDASRIRHAMFEMVMARVCAIACGHEDAIDLDRPGRGLKPRWRTAAIKAGKKIEDFAIAGATSSSRANGRKKTRKAKKQK